MKRVFVAVVAAGILTACTAQVGEDATGEQIYESICARCHGSDLGGGVGPALGPGSDAASQPDEFLITTITRGRGRMPSFSATLNDEQILRVVDYLRSRQQP